MEHVSVRLSRTDFTADFLAQVVDDARTSDSASAFGHGAGIVVEFLAYRQNRHLIGGKPQREAAGGVFSSRTATKRSIEPKGARCIITGRCFCIVGTRILLRGSKRSGRLVDLYGAELPCDVRLHPSPSGSAEFNDQNAASSSSIRCGVHLSPFRRQASMIACVRQDASFLVAAYVFFLMLGIA